MSDILKTSLLHASGKQMVMLGGDCWDQRVTGNTVSEFKWVDGEPVMLIYRHVLGKNTPAFMIELADAWKFATSSGHATKRLLDETSKQAAEALHVMNDKFAIYEIITVILDGIPDLLRMPPEPKAIEIANRPSSGNDELSIKIDGKTVIETVI